MSPQGEFRVSPAGHWPRSLKFANAKRLSLQYRENISCYYNTRIKKAEIIPVSAPPHVCEQLISHWDSHTAKDGLDNELDGSGARSGRSGLGKGGWTWGLEGVDSSMKALQPTFLILPSVNVALYHALD